MTGFILAKCLYYAVGFSGAVSLAAAFMRFIIWLDTPKPNSHT